MEIVVEKINTFTGHRDCVYAVCASGISNVFLSGDGNGMVAEWDINKPEEGILVAKMPNSVYSLCYDKQNHLLIGQNFEGIHEIDLKTKKETRSIKMTDQYIFDIKIHEDNIFVATGNGEVVIIDKITFTIFTRFKLSDKSARTIAISPLNQTFAIGYSDNNIRVFNLKDFTLMHDIIAHKNSVFTLAYSPDQHFLVSGSRDAHLKIWETGNYNLHESIVAHLYAINEVCYSVDNNYFITCSMDKTIKVWDAKTFKLLKVIDKARHAGHNTSINKLLWTTYRDIIISASDDRTLSAWKLNFKN